MTMKPTLLIIEGIDRIGKTTFCNKLQTDIESYNKRNVIYFKDSIQLNTLGDFSVDILDKKHLGYCLGVCDVLSQLSQTQFPKPVYILDRFHITGAVYAKVLRNNYKPLMQNNTIEKVLQDKFDVKLVTFYLTTHVTNEDEVVSIENLEKLNDAFYEVTNNSSLPNLKCPLIGDENGMTDILEYRSAVINFTLG